jgi:hypothetical protein
MRRFDFTGVKRVWEAIYKIEELKGLNENAIPMQSCSFLSSLLSFQSKVITIRCHTVSSVSENILTAIDSKRSRI